MCAVVDAEDSSRLRVASVACDAKILLFAAQQLQQL